MVTNDAAGRQIYSVGRYFGYVRYFNSTVQVDIITEYISPSEIMGKKRHLKAGSNKDEKRRREENAQKWKETSGGDPRRAELKKENPIFEAFYKAQNFLSPEEFGSFISHLQDNLPACFRLNTNYAFVEKLRGELMEYVGTKIPASDSTAEIDAISRLDWCPNAYKMGIDRRAIRRLNVDKIAQLHEWMKKHTENGNITRQEV
jgi:hypothetical protein